MPVQLIAVFRLYALQVDIKVLGSTQSGFTQVVCLLFEIVWTRNILDFRIFFLFYNICICVMRCLGYIPKCEHSLLVFQFYSTYSQRVIFFLFIVLCLSSDHSSTIRNARAQKFWILEIFAFCISNQQYIILMLALQHGHCAQ